ncbi:MAG: bifunctional riboflavin kinase/FAD synthetase [Alphaproteobacteria bacterium]|nr:bifunctional riboflavin kinase/FAD synthetase [Alphaproteobacteria bacterium]
MRLLRDPGGVPADARGAIAAIGNFDGLHRGHQAVIGEAMRLARAQGRKSAVVTFVPHPRRFFKPDLPPFLLASPRMKIGLLRDLGVDFCFALRFGRRIAGMTAEAFVADVLVGGFGLAGVVAGYDFVFGKGRAGSPETLVAEMKRAGRTAKIVAPALDAAAAGNAGADGDPEAFVYSSTGVRDALKAGDPRAAARILGRPFAIDGRVARGDARGRTIGFPTANIALDGYLPPALGVYAVRVAGALAGQTVPGVANLGVRPTVGGDPAPRLEVHLFDFAGDLYGRRLVVSLIEFLRPERKFAGLDELKAQIAIDARNARAILDTSA